MLFPDAFPRADDLEEGEGPIRIGGRYELGKLLRRSPFGTTFAARDAAEENRPCEVQLLDHARDLEALRELRARLAEIPPRHRSPLRAVGRDERGRLFCEWEAIPCETLAERLERHRPLPERHALEMARQILTCLAEAHGRGVAHGSLDLESVLLEEEPRWTDEASLALSVRLADFGLRSLGGNPLATEYDEEGDAFADDRLAVIRILDQTSGGKAPAVRSLLKRFEAGDFPTAGFLLSAIEQAQRSRRTRKSFQLALVAPAMLALLFGVLFLRERGAHARATSELGERSRELAHVSSRATEERNSLEASRALLAAELAREREHTLAGRLEARWRELALSPRTASPEELTAIARYFDDGRLEVALQGYTRALERHLLRDGVVTPRFGDFPSLEAWGRTIRASSALSLSPAGARLLVLEHGHRLTLPGARPEPLPPLLRASLPENPGTVLEEILRRSSLDRAYPGPRGVLRVYREGDRFVRERVVGDRARRIERRVHDGAGTLLEASELSLEPALERVLTWNEPGSWEHVSIPEAPAAGLPLEALGIDAERYRRFRRAVEGRPLEILRQRVSDGNETTLLISPALGELRREGNLQRELVFADLLP